jgi:hypothetical protein
VEHRIRRLLSQRIQSAQLIGTQWSKIRTHRIFDRLMLLLDGVNVDVPSSLPRVLGTHSVVDAGVRCCRRRSDINAFDILVRAETKAPRQFVHSPNKSPQVAIQDVQGVASIVDAKTFILSQLRRK